MRKNILWLFPVVILGWLWKRLLKQRHQAFSEVDIETPEDVNEMQGMNDEEN
ncbi:hypothetical protein [Staphylococcus simulans]|uniref:hypothetical protein n=1 Tax=Staphylococcus simulans TaxID=1286 RepID=UPI001304B3B0|nr:hypothetical protein [Staphylococcus simulans]MDY5060392.1 hypothetical protein [Staphylococcus simulans]